MPPTKTLYHPERKKTVAKTSLGSVSFNDQGAAEVSQEVYDFFMQFEYWRKAQVVEQQNAATVSEEPKKKLISKQTGARVLNTAQGKINVDKDGVAEVPISLVPALLASGWIDPDAEEGTKSGYVPTLEEYVKAGYRAENYEHEFFGLKAGDPYDEKLVEENHRKAKAEEEEKRRKELEEENVRKAREEEEAKEEEQKASAESGDEQKKPLEKMKLDELLAEAQKQEIEVPDGSTKKDIVALLLAKKEPQPQ